MARRRRPELPDPIGDRLLDVTARPVDTFAAPVIRPPVLPTKSFEIGKALSSLAPSLSNFGDLLLQGQREAQLAEGMAEASQYQNLSGPELAEIERKSQGLLPWRYQGILQGRAQSIVNTDGKQKLMELLSTTTDPLDEEGNIRTLSSLQPRLNEIYAGLNIPNNGFSRRAAQDAWSAAVGEFQQNWVQVNRNKVKEYNDSQLMGVVMDALVEAPNGNYVKAWLDTKENADSYWRSGQGVGRRLRFDAGIKFIQSQFPFLLDADDEEFTQLEALMGVMRDSELDPGQVAVLDQVSKALGEHRNKAGIATGARSSEMVRQGLVWGADLLTERLNDIRNEGRFQLDDQELRETVAGLLAEYPQGHQLNADERRRVEAGMMTLARSHMQRGPEDTTHNREQFAHLMSLARRGMDVRDTALYARLAGEISKEQYTDIAAAVNAFGGDRPGGASGGSGSLPDFMTRVSNEFIVPLSNMTPAGRAEAGARLFDIQADVEEQMRALWSDLVARVPDIETRTRMFREGVRKIEQEAKNAFQEYLDTDLRQFQVTGAVNTYETSKDGQATINAVIEKLHGVAVDRDIAQFAGQTVVPTPEALKGIRNIKRYLSFHASSYDGPPEELQGHLDDQMMRLLRMSRWEISNELRPFASTTVGPHLPSNPPPPPERQSRFAEAVDSDTRIAALTDTSTPQQVADAEKVRRDLSTQAYNTTHSLLRLTETHRERVPLLSRWRMFFDPEAGTERMAEPSIRLDGSGNVVDLASGSVDPQKTKALWDALAYTGLIRVSHLDGGMDYQGINIPINRVQVTPDNTSFFGSSAELYAAYQQFVASGTGPFADLVEAYPNLLSDNTAEALVATQASLLRQQNPRVSAQTGEPLEDMPFPLAYNPLRPRPGEVGGTREGGPSLMRDVGVMLEQNRIPNLRSLIPVDRTPRAPRTLTPSQMGQNFLQDARTFGNQARTTLEPLATGVEDIARLTDGAIRAAGLTIRQADRASDFLIREALTPPFRAPWIEKPGELPDAPPREFRVRPMEEPPEPRGPQTLFRAPWIPPIPGSPTRPR